MQESYRPLPIMGPGVWLPKAQLGLGLWQGQYQGIERCWLRWYDQDSQWILTPAEQAMALAQEESQRADREKARADRLAARLKDLGVELDELADETR